MAASTSSRERSSKLTQVFTMSDEEDQNQVEGVKKVFMTHKPLNHYTFFAGAGDLNGLADGEKVLFKMLAADVTKTKYIGFADAIWVKDGVITYQDAPLGATVDIEIVTFIDELPVVVGAFAKAIPLLGTNTLYLNSGERGGQLPSDCKLMITCTNAVEGNDEEAPADFAVTLQVECYRPTNQP